MADLVRGDGIMMAESGHDLADPTVAAFETAMHHPVP